ncbi:hypothetical protein ACFFKC_20725 [Pseudoduganella danionis]|uniref:G domain-containing protein n=2 Tax=Pseudoduganella danionis TaxID=1890295 RepID=A0ABW9SR15_9BURK|nr:hypothetical protein [Pseudoduganella danionis]MTW34465.1 hypothetical protein [Pseudoduganella danionis]
MEVMAPARHWHALQQERLGWAYRAYRRFIDSLSAEVRSHFISASEQQPPYVVVFGMTQVGKTTLLLELMGLDIAAQTRVGQILRGGRASGMSATATTMEYRRSPDQDWHFDDGSGLRRIGSDAAMQAALGELRQRMSERRLHPDQPVVVAIPADCFDSSQTDSGIRMLDLPGDNPADEIEREHVQQMAARYVPHADLILLVGRGDNLSFLIPAALNLPSIEDWQYVPGRFRIVTTFAFTPSTVQSFAAQHPDQLDAALFRARLQQEIRSFDLVLSPEASRPELYYPLELGSSWHAMLAQDTPYARRIQPVVQGLKDSLMADIRASASEAARFRNALDVHVVTRCKREAHLQLAEQQLAQVREQVEQAEALARQASEGAAAAMAEANALHARLAQCSAACEELKTSPSIDASAQVELVNQLWTNTSAFYARINDFTGWLRQQFLDAAPAAGSVTRRLLGKAKPRMDQHIGTVNQLADAEFDVLIRRMGDYWRDEYYPSVSDSFADDKARLKADIRDVAHKVSVLAQNLWMQILAEQLHALEAEAERCARSAASLLHIKTQQNNLRAERLAQADVIHAIKEQALARLERDEAQAARFSTLLDEEYLHELQQRTRHMAGAAQASVALLELLGIVALSDEYRKIKLPQHQTA